jgi:hypothetical protein
MKTTSVSPNYLRYYPLEDYLFKEVSEKFNQVGYLDAFDFFCIIIWKSNRSKSTIAKRLLKYGFTNLEDVSRTLTEQIYQASSPKEKMKIMLMEWGFKLPIASAVLTVLYPKEFTVFDFRVCEILGKYENIREKTNIEYIWPIYQDYIADVKKATPGITSLRDKDRSLWSQSFYEQLKKNIENNFSEGSII